MIRIFLSEEHVFITSSPLSLLRGVPTQEAALPSGREGAYGNPQISEVNGPPPPQGPLLTLGMTSGVLACCVLCLVLGREQRILCTSYWTELILQKQTFKCASNLVKPSRHVTTSVNTASVFSCRHCWNKTSIL